jgi:predicted nucleotidyltransferase
MNENKILESLRKRLEREKEERFKLFTKFRKNLPHIIDIITEFNVEKVILFGSLIDKEKFTESSDIDIGLIGLDKKDFFKLYSRLSDRIPWPIDLVDLDENPKFKAKILERGEIIYDRGRKDNKNINLLSSIRIGKSPFFKR